MMTERKLQIPNSNLQRKFKIQTSMRGEWAPPLPVLPKGKKRGILFSEVVKTPGIPHRTTFLRPGRAQSGAWAIGRQDVPRADNRAVTTGLDSDLPLGAVSSTLLGENEQTFLHNDSD